MWGLSLLESLSKTTSSLKEYTNKRTINYQKSKVITDDNNSVLPFKAFPGDRENINVVYSSMKSGHRIIATDDSLSVPARTLQIDHEKGFNRIVMTGPTYGRVIDKVGNPVYDAGFMIGSGYHQFTEGNMFISGSEIHQCFGNIRNMETESSKYQRLYAVAQSRSSLTMYGRNDDNTLKQYDQFYERHLATVIEGRNSMASRDMFTYKCGSRIVLESSKEYNVVADTKSLYDEVENIENAGSEWQSALESYENKVKSKVDDKLPDTDGKTGIDIIAKDGVVRITANEIIFDAKTRFKVNSDAAIFSGAVLCCGINPNYCEGMDAPSKMCAIDPHVKVSKGYDEIPDNKKACVEDQQDENVYY